MAEEVSEEVDIVDFAEDGPGAFLGIPTLARICGKSPLQCFLPADAGGVLPIRLKACPQAETPSV